MVRLQPKILEAGCIGREAARNDGAEALVESQLAFCAQKPGENLAHTSVLAER
jgi:hypothetical protein